jgi:predicted AAA+ superfamily ATPase
MQAIIRMRRYLQEQLLVDLSRKAVVLTGPRQVGKTRQVRQLMEGRDSPQYLNWDGAAFQTPAWQNGCHYPQA